jgi:hypothetical protein
MNFQLLDKIATAMLGLTLSAAICILLLRWMSPTPAQWTQIDQACHTTICDPGLSPIYWIRGTSFEAWLHTSASLHFAITALGVSLALILSAAGLATARPVKEGD